MERNFNILDTIFYLLAQAAPPDAAQPGIFSSLIPIILIVAVFYFLIIRPQKKREKETQIMRKELEVGNDVVTIGGIIGTIVSIKNDTVVIETSGDRSKIRVYLWAIQQNITPKE